MVILKEPVTDVGF